MRSVKADLDSKIHAEITNDQIVLNIHVTNIPVEVTTLMREKMDEISEAILRAMFAEVSGTEVSRLQTKSQSYTHPLSPSTTTRN